MNKLNKYKFTCKYHIKEYCNTIHDLLSYWSAVFRQLILIIIFIY